MVTTKKSLSRRTLLRGAGATLTLPFLDAMVPTGAASELLAPTRLGFFYVPNGVYQPSFHPKGDGGVGFEFSPTLKSLKPLREHVTVISGAGNPVRPEDAGHSAANAGWLSGITSTPTEAGDVYCGKTLDQHAADVLGQETPVRSLELTMETTPYSTSCELGFSCFYRNSTSWLTPNKPLPHENEPQSVFNRLFSSEVRKDSSSILDSLTGRVSRLSCRLGVSDRRTLDNYVSSIRDVERKIQALEDAPGDYRVRTQLMFDLLWIAFRGDITRVSSTQLGLEGSERQLPWLGVTRGHHTLSHHGNDKGMIADLRKVDTYYVSLFRDFISKLRDTPDGDGSLLDHSLMVYGSGLGDGNTHGFDNVPLVLAGRANGRIEGGRHIRFRQPEPLMNVGLDVLAKAGVNIGQLAGCPRRAALA